MKKNKVKVEAFFPFSACTCTYAPLMEKIGRVTAKFKDSVEFQVKSTTSKEARKYSVQGACVIVDGVIRLPADFSENELEEAIITRNSRRE
ncbi:MAG: hypothetical protein QXJ40_02135 [Candidatus Bathyarchaeia archaeon]